ncbi:integrator complex subunit 6-like isoform X14 [Molossus molossus]|uniref:integrator complex subunit 6-like isoform X14 n=1 Tax=Molossus molossus TaxID=27622 RepID=UPI001745CAF4|nr:integrator complex subunit 6-like isoform X14 [Molossus molossus]
MYAHGKGMVLSLEPLKKALRMMGAPNLISDNLDCGLSYSVISYLKKLSQQTKIESERILASVGKKPPQEIGIKVKNHSGGGLSLTHSKNFRKLLKKITGETSPRLTELNTKEFAGFQVGFLNKDLKPQTYRNAYDVSRRGLLDQLTRMRSNLLKTHKFIVGQDEDSLHSVPVAQMGNYQEYLKTLASPLREIDPDQPKRLHTFGNPFKQDKKGMMIDEADEFVTGPQNKVKRPGEPNSPLSSKRRRSMSLLLRKPQTPPTVTNHVGRKGPPSALWFPSYPNLIKPTLVHTDATVTHDVHEEKMENGQIPPDGFLSKSAAPEFMNMTGDGIPSNQLDSLSDDFTSLRKDDLINKPGSNALVGRIKNCSVSADDQKVSVSSFETVPNTLQITPAMAQGINADIKHQLMKEVRKFGRKYERIFILLEGVQGPLAVKKQFVEFTIKEAARFKRRVLIQYLEKVLEKIDPYHLLNNVNHVNSRSSC